jgi:uncharacterized short protein YbdD (DUF466 family)
MQPASHFALAAAKPLDRKLKLRRWARRFWRGVREWCGDAAYERYLRCSATRAATCGTLTAEEFYVEQLNRRYSRPNRCC